MYLSLTLGNSSQHLGVAIPINDRHCNHSKTHTHTHTHYTYILCEHAYCTILSALEVSDYTIESPEERKEFITSCVHTHRCYESVHIHIEKNQVWDQLQVQHYMAIDIVNMLVTVSVHIVKATVGAKKRFHTVLYLYRN